ncbi:PREDICTED: CDK2-associated and cullin domain-containing protein 1 [Myotis davidii]|uniref:CDK2-associated and cullin domain-containing protein 1 n=1 Tax=Myotis davidii TaxID=225400 RepID=UPI000766F423|nr:PREDICTED: CDK2-associated and cullin domain-containing protein 1 [Myotis davidii]
MNVITIEDYKSTYWPKLDGAIDQLLTQSPGDYIPISYEQIYSCVYKCVCQQHSEQMYSDLIKKITNHLERVSKELQASPPDVYIERFNIALGQYMGALQSIVPLFIYMNKFYIETKLNRDLKDDLIKLFTEHVAEKHIYSLMPLLLEAQSTPFQVTPSTMANIVKGLYTLRPEWVQMAPTLFSKFIPNILPPAVESELSEYAAQDQKLQRELMQNGFMRLCSTYMMYGVLNRQYTALMWMAQKVTSPGRELGMSWLITAPQHVRVPEGRLLPVVSDAVYKADTMRPRSVSRERLFLAASLRAGTDIAPFRLSGVTREGDLLLGPGSSGMRDIRIQKTKYKGLEAPPSGKRT